MTETSALLTPHLGFGLGLRKEHYEAVLADRPEIGWFEVITENYLLDRGILGGGKPLDYLDRIRAHYLLAMQGCRYRSAGPSRSIGA